MLARPLDGPKKASNGLLLLGHQLVSNGDASNLGFQTSTWSRSLNTGILPGEYQANLSTNPTNVNSFKRSLNLEFRGLAIVAICTSPVHNVTTKLRRRALLDILL